MIRRIPKRGFHNAWGKTVATVNVSDLEAAFQSGEEVTLASLRAKHLAKGRFDELKILGDGELTKKLKISAHRFSHSALAKIQEAGGQAIVLPGKKPIVKGVAKQRPQRAQSQIKAVRNDFVPDTLRPARTQVETPTNRDDFARRIGQNQISATAEALRS